MEVLKLSEFRMLPFNKIWRDSAQENNRVEPHYNKDVGTMKIALLNQG